MICPHCGKETGEIMKPARMKNLQITGWCMLCRKPKGYSGTLVFGESSDEGVQEVPTTCSCGLYQQQAAYNFIP